jgi:hypothetical protein
MDMDGLTVSAGTRSGGTLLLNNGRSIIVQSISHVGEAFLFFSLPGSAQTHVVGHDEIQSWLAAPVAGRWNP